MTSDILGFDGDGVVHWSRQWLYDGTTPYPTDGTAGRLSDSVLINRFHTAANDYAEEVIRGLDEPDYPFFAYKVEMDKTYSYVLTRRAGNVAEGSPTTDVDFFKIDIPSDHIGGLNIDLSTHSEKDIKVTYYMMPPADFLAFGDNGDMQQLFPANSGNQNMLIPANLVTPDETVFVKIQADGVDFDDWEDPLTFHLSAAAPLAVELASFWGEQNDHEIQLFWKTAHQLDAEEFIIERSHNGFNFSKIGTLVIKNGMEALEAYQFVDSEPLIGHNYYRLKTIDQNGKLDYSESLHFVFKTAQTIVKNVYPIPADRFALLELQVAQSQQLDWLMVDAIGKVVLRGTKTLEEGEQQLYINLENVPIGVYFVSLVGNDIRDKVKVLKK